MVAGSGWANKNVLSRSGVARSYNLGVLVLYARFSFAQHSQRALFRRLCKVKFLLGFCTVLFAHGLTTEYVDAQLQNGLVGHWSFDEGTGTIASDYSGNANTATL